MRVLVTGASGFIGQYLLLELAQASAHEVHGAYHTRQPPLAGCQWHPLDLTDQPQLRGLLDRINPQAVVHLAAISDVGRAEANPALATLINTTSVETIVRYCAQHGAKLVFLSSDYVFAGDRGRYREEETPAPTTQYGRTKWAAEQLVAGNLADWSSLRATLVYGWPPPGCHGNLVTAILSRLEQGQPFTGYADMYRTPTYVRDVVAAIRKLLDEDHPGVSHVAGPDWVNMLQFAIAVAERFNLDRRLAQAAGSPQDDAENKRPRLLGLDASQTARRLGISLTPVAAGLAQMQDERRRLPWLQPH